MYFKQNKVKNEISILLFYQSVKISKSNIKHLLTAHSGKKDLILMVWHAPLNTQLKLIIINKYLVLTLIKFSDQLLIFCRMVEGLESIPANSGGRCGTLQHHTLDT